MTPQARVQAAIEILDLVIAAARANGAPADRIVSDWFRTRRFAGSKDRRAVRELVYGAIRACGPVPQNGRAAMLRLAQRDTALASLFDGSRHAPEPIAVDESVAEGGVAPTWLEAALSDSGICAADAEALLERAPLDLRVNTLKAYAATLELPEPAERGLAPNSLRLPHGTQVEGWDAYLNGQVEVQDAGSQLVCSALAVQPGELVVDLCAGAGGKTLALAAAMDNRGRLVACDVDRTRLSRLEPRAMRAGVAIAQTRLLDPNREDAALADLAGQVDAVLVDAPCSGTGTWRRNPEARWRLTPRTAGALRGDPGAADRPCGQSAAARRSAGICNLFAAGCRRDGPGSWISCTSFRLDCRAVGPRCRHGPRGGFAAFAGPRRDRWVFRRLFPEELITERTMPSLREQLMRYTPAALALSLLAAVTASVSISTPPVPLDPRAALLVADGRKALVNGDANAAIDAYEAALVIQPGHIAILLNLAEATRKQGMQGKALRYYREVLEAEPGNVFAISGEGQALVEKGAVERARRNLARLEQICGSNCVPAKDLAAAIAQGPAPQIVTADAVQSKLTVSAN